MNQACLKLPDFVVGTCYVIILIPIYIENHTSKSHKESRYQKDNINKPSHKKNKKLNWDGQDI